MHIVNESLVFIRNCLETRMLEQLLLAIAFIALRSVVIWAFLEIELVIASEHSVIHHYCSVLKNKATGREEEQWYDQERTSQTDQIV